MAGDHTHGQSGDRQTGHAQLRRLPQRSPPRTAFDWTKGPPPPRLSSGAVIKTHLNGENKENGYFLIRKKAGQRHRCPSSTRCRQRQEARAATSGEYLVSLPVEMQALDWKLETEPKAQHDLPAGWSRTLPMTVHGGHSAMASRSRPYSPPELHQSLRHRWRGTTRRSRCPHQSPAESRTRRHPHGSRPSPDRRRKQRRRSSKSPSAPEPLASSARPAWTLCAPRCETGLRWQRSTGPHTRSCSRPCNQPELLPSLRHPLRDASRRSNNALLPVQVGDQQQKHTVKISNVTATHMWTSSQCQRSGTTKFVHGVMLMVKKRKKTNAEQP